MKNNKTTAQKATIPIPILYSQPSLDTPGDHIDWKIGDTAWWTSKVTKKRHPVLIDSGIVGHASAPGEQCREVIFIDENGTRECVSASQLRIRI